jgi:hypothetical protein
VRRRELVDVVPRSGVVLRAGGRSLEFILHVVETVEIF